MKTLFNLTIDRKGSVRVSKGKPNNLAWDEVTIQMNLELPNHLFEKPQLQAKITVTDEQVQPLLITPEIKNNIQEALQTAAGMQVRLEIVEPLKEV